MSTEFASADYTAGQLNAMVKLLKKQAGEDAPERFLRGEIIVAEPVRSWREEDGVIYFSVTSDGTTGPEWIARLEKKGDRVGTYAKQLLCSSDFHPTTGVTYNIAVFKGMLFNDRDRNTKKIRQTAGERRLTTPNAEIACLIRDKFTDAEIEDMGLIWLVTMHEPIKDSDGGLNLLVANRRGSGRWLDADYGYPGFQWFRGSGFAFVSQVN